MFIFLLKVLHELDRRNNSFQQQMESIVRERQELSEVRNCADLSSHLLKCQDFNRLMCNLH